MNATTNPGVDDGTGGTNIGWIAGLIVIVAVLAVMGALWFTYHP